MKMGNKEVPKNIKSALQPRRPDVFAANTDFMQVKGKIAIVNFYEQVATRMSELVSCFQKFQGFGVTALLITLGRGQ